MSASFIGSFILASLLVVISPGPATLFVLRRCQGSFGEPIRAVAGIVTGDVVLITLSGLGIATLVGHFPELASAIKLAGSGYIAWVGFNLVASQAAGQRTEMPIGSSLLGGLLITLSNPKAILFFAAFFPLFMDVAQPAPGQIVRLAAIFEAVNLAFYALFIVAARSFLQHIESRKTGVLRIASGLALMGVASIVCGATLTELL